jgi:hypothetical protein
VCGWFIHCIAKRETTFRFISLSERFDKLSLSQRHYLMDLLASTAAIVVGDNDDAASETMHEIIEGEKQRGKWTTQEVMQDAVPYLLLQTRLGSNLKRCRSDSWW